MSNNGAIHRRSFESRRIQFWTKEFLPQRCRYIARKVKTVVKYALYHNYNAFGTQK